MRIGTLVVLALGIALNGGAAKSAAEITCPWTPLPSEGSATEQDQLAFLSDQATACLGEGKLARTIALLSEVIRRAPTDATAYLNRGSAQASAGEVALALNDTDFTEAMRLKPGFALAYCNRGLANFQLGRYDDALADYSIAIEQDARLSYCHFNQIPAFRACGDCARWPSAQSLIQPRSCSAGPRFRLRPAARA